MMTELDHATCYAAARRNHPYLDGTFFSAVLTTGVFCRPICRARTPRPENVRYFATAAAAAAAGFRPCLVCRPESAPDPFEGQITSPVVRRALHLIGEGFLDQANVAELAGRLHLSSRHLRRLFLDEFGAPPVAVAQTRRLLFAKKLIDETTLSMAEIAFSAGYMSVRRFNEAIRQTYARTPSELRRRRRPLCDPSGTTIELKLFYRPPYNWSAVLSFLRAQATPLVEAVDAQGYRRTIRMGGMAGVLEVRPRPDERAVVVRIPSNLAPSLLPITERVKHLFDLKAEPARIDGYLSGDPCLAPIVREQRGMRVPGAWDGYELAIRAMLAAHQGQQGTHLAAILVEAFGEQWVDSSEAVLSHLFPTPDILIDAPLSGIGMPAMLGDAIRMLSQAVLERDVALNGSANADTVTALLAALPGIDEATVQYIAMRALREPDAFPAGSPLACTPAADAGLADIDVGLQSERWRPWRAYAALYRWVASVENASHLGDPVHCS